MHEASLHLPTKWLSCFDSSSYEVTFLHSPGRVNIWLLNILNIVVEKYEIGVRITTKFITDSIFNSHLINPRMDSYYKLIN